MSSQHIAIVRKHEIDMLESLHTHLFQRADDLVEMAECSTPLDDIIAVAREIEDIAETLINHDWDHLRQQ
jgi:hypothetical protein